MHVPEFGMGATGPEPPRRAARARSEQAGREPPDHRGRHSSQGADRAVRDDLTQRLADLARELQRQTDASAVMGAIVSSAPGTIPGAEEASITLVQRRRRVVSAASTGEL